MSVPHPLNQAVIAQALHDLRNGQLRRCKAMGFGEQELSALKHPALVSVLIGLPFDRSCCNEESSASRSRCRWTAKPLR